MPEFDWRASTPPHDLAGQAQRHALAKVVVRQRYAPDCQRQDLVHGLRRFFRGR